MPRLPDLNDLGPRQAPVDRGFIVNSPQGIGRAVEGLGQTLGNVADQIDTLKAQDALIKLRQSELDLTDGEGGYSRLKGGQVLEKPIVDEYGQKFRTAADGISQGLKNEQQRRKFDQVAKADGLQFQAGVLRHQMQESEVFKKQTNVGTLQVEGETATRNYADPQKQAISMDRADSVFANRITDGESPELVAADRAKYFSVLHGNAIQAAVNDGKLEVAQSYLETHKDSIDPDSYRQLDNLVNAEFVDRDAPKIAQGLYNGDLKSSLKRANDLAHHQMRNAVSAQIRMLYSYDQADQRENQAALSYSASEGMAALASGVQLTPEVTTQIQSTINGLRKAGSTPAQRVSFGRQADQLENAQGASQLASQMSAMSLPEQQAFAEQHIAQLPQDTDLSSAQKSQYTATFLRSAFQNNVKQVAADPYGLYAKQTGQVTPPLDLTQDIGAQLTARVGTATKIQARWGVPVGLLQPQESKFVSQALEQMPPSGQVQMLAQLANGLKDPALYNRTVQQIAPDSPVRAMAGIVAAQPGSIATATHWFRPDETASRQQIAETMLVGENLLNKTKATKAGDGSSKGFPMPKDAEFQTAFSDYAGTVFANQPQAYDIAMQGVRAYYTGKAAQDGDISGEVNPDRLRQAARAVLGEKTSFGGADVLVPIGMSASDFNDRATAALTAGLAGIRLGANAPGVRDIALESAGETTYRAKVGRAYIVGADGNPLVIDVAQ